MGLVRIAGYPMDLSISEGHTFPGEATKFPVEVGPDVSDHIRELPEEITLECLVSDIVPSQVASDPARGQTVTTPDGEIQFVLPSEEALAKLREIKALRKPVAIETSIGVFPSMAFVSLDVPRDKDKNNALFFTAKFQKFNQVTNNRTKVRVRSDMAGAGGQKRIKAVVSNVVRIDNTATWNHGSPPGGLWIFGFPDRFPSEPILVTYTGNSGLSKDEFVALGEATPGCPLIRYFRQDGTEILGVQRANLRLDLERDQLGKRRAQQRQQEDADRERAARQFDNSPELNKMRNLPPGLDLSRFDRPEPPTFANTLPNTP